MAATMVAAMSATMVAAATATIALPMTDHVQPKAARVNTKGTRSFSTNIPQTEPPSVVGFAITVDTMTVAAAAAAAAKFIVKLEISAQLGVVFAKIPDIQSIQAQLAAEHVTGVASTTNNIATAAPRIHARREDAHANKITTSNILTKAKMVVVATHVVSSNPTFAMIIQMVLRMGRAIVLHPLTVGVKIRHTQSLQRPLRVGMSVSTVVSNQMLARTQSVQAILVVARSMPLVRRQAMMFQNVSVPAMTGLKGMA